MMKNTLTVAFLIGSSSAGGILLSEAHGHVLSATVKEDAVRMSRTPNPYFVQTLETFPTMMTQKDEPKFKEFVVGELAPRRSMRPNSREIVPNSSYEELAMQNVVPVAVIGNVVTVTVTKRVPKRDNQPKTDAVARQRSLLHETPKQRRDRSIFRIFGKRQQNDRTQQHSPARREILHGVYR